MSAPVKRSRGRPGPVGASLWPKATMRLAPDAYAALCASAAGHGVTPSAEAAARLTASLLGDDGTPEASH